MKRLSMVAALCLVISLTAVLGGRASAATGGPDGGGYTWTDTNSPAPTTTYDYIDIIDSGTDLEFGDDDATGVELPFAFNFYGTDYNGMVISSNGFVSFDTDDTDICNDNYNWDSTIMSPDEESDAGFPIPHGDAACDDDGWGANPLIAAWFTDQDPGECGAVWYDVVGSAPNRTLVVQWNVCNNADPTADIDCSVDFELLLFEGSNDIKMQYRDTTYSCGEVTHYEDNGALATVGLDRDGAVGLQYEWNEPVLQPELAVLYRQGAVVVAQPTATPHSCIPGLPPTFSCGGQSGGGAGQPKATATAKPTTPTAAPSPNPVATTPPVVQPSPTRSGGTLGEILAPDTGSGGSDPAGDGHWLAIALGLMAAGSGVLGIAARARRRAD